MTSWYGVDSHRFNPDGTPVARVGGELETCDGDEAWRVAIEWAGIHPTAASLIHRDGDPYAWVHTTPGPTPGTTTVHVKECDTGVERSYVQSGPS